MIIFLTLNRLQENNPNQFKIASIRNLIYFVNHFIASECFFLTKKNEKIVRKQFLITSYESKKVGEVVPTILEPSENSRSEYEVPELQLSELS